MSLTPKNRNRQSSQLKCTPPSARQYCYRELVNVGNSHLIRSFSCGHIVDSEKNTSFCATTFSVISKRNEEKFSRKRKLNFEEPNIRKKLKYTTASATLWLDKCRIISLTLSVVIITYLLCSSSVLNYLKEKIYGAEWNLSWNTDLLIEDLKRSLYGQEKAVEDMKNIFTSLQNFSTWPQYSIIAITGPIGVGKTYTANIIAAHFPMQEHLRIVFADRIAESNFFLEKRGGNLIIIEDCSPKNIQVVIDFIDKLTKVSKHTDSKFIIIIIFTSQQSLFPKNHLNPKIVKFQELSVDSLRKCFNFEAKRLGVTINDFDTLVMHHLFRYNETNSSPGCKNIDVILSKYI